MIVIHIDLDTSPKLPVADETSASHPNEVVNDRLEPDKSSIETHDHPQRSPKAETTVSNALSDNAIPGLSEPLPLQPEASDEALSNTADEEASQEQLVYVYGSLF